MRNTPLLLHIKYSISDRNGSEVEEKPPRLKTWKICNVVLAIYSLQKLEYKAG